MKTKNDFSQHPTLPTKLEISIKGIKHSPTHMLFICDGLKNIIPTGVNIRSTLQALEGRGNEVLKVFMLRKEKKEKN